MVWVVLGKDDGDASWTSPIVVFLKLSFQTSPKTCHRQISTQNDTLIAQNATLLSTKIEKIICTHNKRATEAQRAEGAKFFNFFLVFKIFFCSLRSKYFLWILTGRFVRHQPNGTCLPRPRSTSRLFIKELENELTFDAKTFSISVTRTMDGNSGENDYDYVAIGN